MTRMPIILLFAVGILTPGFAGALSEKDFEAKTAEEMINLCTVSPDDRLYHKVTNFCPGYLTLETKWTCISISKCCEKTVYLEGESK